MPGCGMSCRYKIIYPLPAYQRSLWREKHSDHVMPAMCGDLPRRSQFLLELRRGAEVFRRAVGPISWPGLDWAAVCTHDTCPCSVSIFTAGRAQRTTCSGGNATPDRRFLAGRVPCAGGAGTLPLRCWYHAGGIRRVGRRRPCGLSVSGADMWGLSVCSLTAGICGTAGRRAAQKCPVVSERPGCRRSASPALQRHPVCADCV